jgi:hypothetical protein
MYLPSIMISIVYALRTILRQWFPASMKMRKFLVFILAMYGLILLFGCFTGYARWLAFSRDGIEIPAEVVFNGACADNIYIEGRYRRAYKRIIIASNDSQPFTDQGNTPCIGYRFETPSGWVYALEEIASPARYALPSHVSIKFDPAYLENNWLIEYIPATMQSSLQYAWFFAGVLLETAISGYLIGIRRVRFRS